MLNVLLSRRGAEGAKMLCIFLLHEMLSFLFIFLCDLGGFAREHF